MSVHFNVAHPLSRDAAIAGAAPARAMTGTVHAIDWAIFRREIVGRVVISVMGFFSKIV
ncbi:hypothetical protein GCM10009861_16720 [Neomicrococcus aestuarii]